MDSTISELQDYIRLLEKRVNELEQQVKQLQSPEHFEKLISYYAARGAAANS